MISTVWNDDTEFEMNATVNQTIEPRITCTQTNNVHVLSLTFEDIIKRYKQKPEYPQYCIELFDLGTELNKICHFFQNDNSSHMHQQFSFETALQLKTEESVKVHEFLIQSLPQFIERLFDAKQTISSVLSKEILYGASLTIFQHIRNSIYNEQAREVIYFKLKSRMTVWNNEQTDTFKTVQHKLIKRLLIDKIPIKLFIQQIFQHCDKYVSKFEKRPQWLRDQFTDMISEIEYYSDIDEISATPRANDGNGNGNGDQSDSSHLSNKNKNSAKRSLSSFGSIFMESGSFIKNLSSKNAIKVSTNKRNSLSFISKLDLESGMNCESSENSVELSKPVSVIHSTKHSKKKNNSNSKQSSNNEQNKSKLKSMNDEETVKVTCCGKSMDKLIPILYMMGPLCLLFWTLCLIACVFFRIPVFFGNDRWFAVSRTLI